MGGSRPTMARTPVKRAWRGQPNRSWAGPNVDRTSNVPAWNVGDGYFSVPPISGAASEKRKTRHERDARARDLAQRTPAVGEAAADRGADGGDEAPTAGGGVNAGAHSAGAAMEADEGAEA